MENLVNEVQKVLEFSSPFIEERLYFHDNAKYCSMCGKFSSPFIEERLYLLKNNISTKKKFSVLVPFYRGAVVFKAFLKIYDGSLWVLVPFYRGAVVFPPVGLEKVA